MNTPNYILNDYFSPDWFRYPRLGPTTLPAFEFTETDKRKLEWCFDKGIRMSLCAYFKNVERGLDCTAQNCPCELYEADL